MDKLALALLLMSLSAVAQAGSAAREAGRTAGDFGVGVGEAVGAGVARSFENLQPQWITINPRSKEECLKESSGVVNPVYVRCRNGHQEFVQYDAAGNKKVLSERPIPMQ